MNSEHLFLEQHLEICSSDYVNEMIFFCIFCMHVVG